MYLSGEVNRTCRRRKESEDGGYTSEYGRQRERDTFHAGNFSSVPAQHMVCTIVRKRT
jgi:hypothetical protein